MSAWCHEPWRRSTWGKSTGLLLVILPSNFDASRASNLSNISLSGIYFKNTLKPFTAKDAKDAKENQCKGKSEQPRLKPFPLTARCPLFALYRSSAFTLRPSRPLRFRMFCS
jgi:hypothetical protein